jgi:enamine deaminase RidA (YjgF/YER057c/UK114 family)
MSKSQTGLDLGRYTAQSPETPPENPLETRMSVAQRLAELNITLPPVATPAAAYVPFAITGNLVFLSGHIARQNGKPWVGQLGLDTDTATGQAAARAIAIDLIGTLQAACQSQGKTLEDVSRIVKVLSLVNSTPTFTEQHLVTNGCSELLGQVFGTRSAHARSAFGVAQLPMGACVEIELIAELA